ncbi:MAG TPA: type VI secretion system tube protein TssD [Steroidobacteraceae bacterium]|nr:type VI secretion system tube protein TssD [Steroidobacteraceae bacterium]
MNAEPKQRIPARAALLAMLAFASGAVADEVYFSVKGSSGALIQGEVTTTPVLAGKMRALKVTHQVNQPVDALTGMPTGRIVHGPVRITRERGRASPRLLQAFLQNEVLPEVVIEYWVMRKTVSTINQYQIVKLKNARIVKIEHAAEQAAGQPAGQLGSIESVEFTYSTIEYTDIESGNTTTGTQTAISR